MHLRHLKLLREMMMSQCVCCATLGEPLHTILVALKTRYQNVRCVT